MSDNGNGLDHIGRGGVSWAALGLILSIVVPIALGAIWLGTLTKQVDDNHSLLSDDRLLFNRLIDNDESLRERTARLEAQMEMIKMGFHR